VKLERILLHVFGLSGLLSALASMAARIVAKESDWWAVFACASLLAIWVALYSQFLNIRRHQTIIEGVLETVRQHEDDPRLSLIRMVMRSVFFRGTFPAIFWGAYGERLRLRSGEDEIAKLQNVLDAIRSSRVQISGPDVYPLMTVLAHLVWSHGEKYQATACLSELSESAESRMFLLGLPQFYPGLVMRIIEVDSVRDFASLEDQQKEDLRQQLRSHVELRYWLKTDGRLPNFGVYGNRAVGELVAGVNTVTFDTSYVNTKKEEFHRHWMFARGQIIEETHLRQSTPGSG
jgi:hypothetical protein